MIGFLNNNSRRCLIAQRVWDRFLTEQDKATLVPKTHRSVGFGERPALLLIDLYRWVFGDKPEPVTEAIQDLAGELRAGGLERAASYSETHRQGARGGDSRHSHHRLGRRRRRALVFSARR